MQPCVHMSIPDEMERLDYFNTLETNCHKCKAVPIYFGNRCNKSTVSVYKFLAEKFYRIFTENRSFS